MLEGTQEQSKNMNFTQTDAKSQCTNACGCVISGKNENMSNMLKHWKIQHSTKYQECHVYDTDGQSSLHKTRQQEMTKNNINKQN